MQRYADVYRWLEAIRFCRRIALDTNAVIYSLQTVAPYAELTSHLLQLLRRRLITAVIPVVVETEVLVKPLREADAALLERIELFFRRIPNLAVRDVDRAIARRAGLVRAATALSLPDAIVVATALEERCDTIIGNDKAMNQLTAVRYLHLDNFIRAA